MAWYNKDQQGKALYKQQLDGLEEIKRVYNPLFKYAVKFLEDGRLAIYVNVPFRETEQVEYEFWKFLMVYSHNYPEFNIYESWEPIKMYLVSHIDVNFHTLCDSNGNKRISLEMPEGNRNISTSFSVLLATIRWIAYYNHWKRNGKKPVWETYERLLGID